MNYLGCFQVQNMSDYVWPVYRLHYSKQLNLNKSNCNFNCIDVNNLKIDVNFYLCNLQCVTIYWKRAIWNIFNEMIVYKVFSSSFKSFFSHIYNIGDVTIAD